MKRDILLISFIVALFMQSAAKDIVVVEFV